MNQIREDLMAGNVTCRHITQYYLQNIKEKSNLNAFLEVYEDEALTQADLIDEKIANGSAGKLAGMVIGLKDVLCHQDHALQASSKMLSGFISQFNGTAIERVLKEDVIVIGRQNCDEFAMGSSNEQSAFGPTLNEANYSKVSGGSSGGSAVSVQADLCLASLGSDTGGSIRQPASFCGIIGLKPTYSRISRHGLIAYASSFDTIGILSKSIEDTARLLEVMAGADEFDSTVSHKEVPCYIKDLNFNKKTKIGYIKDTIENKGVSPEVKKNTKDILDKLKNEGHTVEPLDLKFQDYILSTYYILTTAEASSNLSRYDGIKFGHRNQEARNLVEMYKKSRGDGFGKEVKKRIMLGTFVLSAEYYDAFYTKAQKVRRLIKEETDNLLSEYEFILLPTTPSSAFKLGEHSTNSLSMYLEDLFTVQASLSGVPAISIPNGIDNSGMPVGLQIMSKEFGESELLSFSKYLLNLN